jgi:hypothetical protein
MESSRAGIFSLFRNSDRLAGTFHWSEDASTAWLVPFTAKRSRFLKAGFFKTGKGAENTKEKSRHCFPHMFQSFYHKGLSYISLTALDCYKNRREHKEKAQ